jgi:putative hemolysin
VAWRIAVLSEIILVLVLIVLNGFFALSEMAIVSSRKARLKHEADKGNESYRHALETARQPARFLSTIQVAITLIGICIGAIGGATISRSLEKVFISIPLLSGIAAPLAVALVVVLTTLFSVVLGELVPKSLALSKPEKIASLVVGPLKVVSTIFDPVVKLLSALTSGILKLFGTKPGSEPEVTEEEIKVLIAQGAKTGIFENSEREMVEGVLRLDDRRVTTFMTPRTDVVVLDLADKDISPRDTIISNSSFACLPVVEGDLDNILGMISIRESLASIASGNYTDPRSLVHPAVLIPETVSALKAISTLMDAGISTALIVDEYGGVSGLVTLGDLLDSVLGGFAITQDQDEPGITVREDGSYLVDGALPLDEFAKKLRIDASLFDYDTYETVAGLTLACLGSIPKPGDTCIWRNLHIEIVDMDVNRIDKVIVTTIPDEGVDAGS